MKYTYYAPVKSDKHYLYAKEVYQYLKDRFEDPKNILSIQLITKYLQTAEQRHNEQPLYYKHKYGLTRVYPHAREAIRDFLYDHFRLEMPAKPFLENVFQIPVKDLMDQWDWTSGSPLAAGRLE